MDYQKFTGLSQALFEASNEARFLLDARMEQVLEVNAAGQRLSGFSLKDLISTPVSKLFRHKSGPGLGPLTGNGRRANRFDMGHCELKSFQPEVWLKVDVALTRLCANPEILWLVRIRDTRSSIAQSTKGAALLQRIVNSVSTCLWAAEASPFGETCLHFMSQPVLQITGRPPEHYGRSLGPWREIVHPDDRAIWDNAQRNRLSGDSTDDEYRIIWPDESIRWVRDCVRTERAYLGAPCWLFGTVSDVSRWK